MESLRNRFDNERYPFKYLLKAPLSGAQGFEQRLNQAAEALGFDMPMARQFVEDYDDQGGGASYFLYAIALTREDQYPRLLDELDRLTVEHIQDLDRHQTEHAGLSHTESLLRDYAEQVADARGIAAPVVRGIAYQEIAAEAPGIAPRDDLLADYYAQAGDRPQDFGREDDFELGLEL